MFDAVRKKYDENFGAPSGGDGPAWWIAAANKRTAGVFLDTLSSLASKAIKKNGEFVLPGFGKRGDQYHPTS